MQIINTNYLFWHYDNKVWCILIHNTVLCYYSCVVELTKFSFHSVHNNVGVPNFIYLWKTQLVYESDGTRLATRLSSQKCAYIHIVQQMRIQTSIIRIILAKCVFIWAHSSIILLTHLTFLLTKIQLCTPLNAPWPKHTAIWPLYALKPL